MDELIPINHKEFNEFIKGRGFRGRKDFGLKNLKAKFNFKPLVERRVLMFSLEDMEPTMFGSARETAKATDVGEGAIRYVRGRGMERNFVRRYEGGSIKICHK